MGLVQYNSDGPNRTNIRSRCRQMLNKTFGATPFDRLVAITRQRSGKRCVFDIDQSGVTDAISFEKHLVGYANATNSERSFPCKHSSRHSPFRLCFLSRQEQVGARTQTRCAWTVPGTTRPASRRRAAYSRATPTAPSSTSSARRRSASPPRRRTQPSSSTPLTTGTTTPAAAESSL